MTQVKERAEEVHTLEPPAHPLEPLSKAEVAAAVEAVRQDRRATPTTRFVSVMLNEPPKHAVVNYEPGARIEREAFVVLLDNATGQCVEAIVSLTGHVVTSWRLLEGVQPAIMLDEFVECEEAVKRSPEFLEALRKRGVDDVDLVMVDPWSAGAYGVEPEDDKGRRLTRALAWVRSDPTDNGYARPLEGVIVVVDLNRMEVLRVEDYGVVPLAPEPGNWTRTHIMETRTDSRPLEVIQRDGPSFTVNGHEIRWQKWRFRIGFTPREGLVLYTVGYEDQGRLRPVLYRASLSDMVVPYGDPGESSFRKNAFDIGEYGIGQLANPLKLGCDCLGEIRYFDAHMVDSRGGLATIENAVCLHEEDNGILWKHTDWRTEEVEVRRSRRLVVSFISTVGNYEYAFYWNFYQDGTLELEIKLTGIANTTGLMPGEKPRYGTEVAPQLNAPYHQHIFNARLDMSVDGDANSGVRGEHQGPATRRGEPPRQCLRRGAYPVRTGAGGAAAVQHDIQPLLEDRQRAREEPDGGAGRVPADAGGERGPLRAGRRGGAEEGRIPAAPHVGHPVRGRREVRRGRLSEPEGRGRRAAPVD